MTKLIFLTMVLSFGFVQGCASIFCGASKTVTIRSEPSSAKFVVKDHDGIAIHNGITPATVSLKRGSGYFRAGDYTVTFEKVGYEKALVPAESSIEWGWYGAGNCAWLIVGAPIAWFIVDPITGGMYNIHDVNAKLELAKVADNGKKITGYVVEDKNGTSYKMPVFEDGSRGKATPVFDSE
jgi:hypothetical protein